MEPQTNHNPSFELPIPDLQQGIANNEKVATPEIQSNPSTGQVPVVPTLPPITTVNPLLAIPNSVTTTSPQPPINTSNIPEDTDLIDKLWVEKAKSIINQTRSDPYNQNKQVNKIKAEYMKGHFNKDIKVSE